MDLTTHHSYAKARRAAIGEKVLFGLALTIAEGFCVIWAKLPTKGLATDAFVPIFFVVIVPALLFLGANGVWKLWALDPRQPAFDNIRRDFQEAENLLAQREETPEAYLCRTANEIFSIEREVEKISGTHRGEILLMVHNNRKIPWFNERDLLIRCGLIEAASKVARILG